MDKKDGRWERVVEMVMCGRCVQAEPFMCTYVGALRYIGEGKMVGERVLVMWEKWLVIRNF